MAARATALDTAGEVGLMTEDGYSVDATYEFRTGPITIDPTASAPGETEVVIPTSGSVGLVNTTSERETSVASIGLSSRALYPLAGDVCQTLMASEEVLVASSDDYCFLKLGSGVDWSMTEDDVLPPDGTSTRTTADLVTDDVSETRLVVPAVEAEMLADQLRDPAGLVLSAPYESNPWTDGSDYWADDDPCLTDLNVGSTELTFLFFATSETPSDYCPPPPDHGDGGIYFKDPFA